MRRAWAAGLSGCSDTPVVPRIARHSSDRREAEMKTAETATRSRGSPARYGDALAAVGHALSSEHPAQLRIKTHPPAHRAWSAGRGRRDPAN